MDDSFFQRLNILLIKCRSFWVRTKALFAYFVQQSSEGYLISFCFILGQYGSFMYVYNALWSLSGYVRLLNQSISSSCFEIRSLYRYPLIKFYWTVEKWHIILHLYDNVFVQQSVFVQGKKYTSWRITLEISTKLGHQ